MYRDVPTNQEEDEEAKEESGDDDEGVGGEDGGVARQRNGRGEVGSSYRISHRNPQYCGAENSCLWELKEVCVCVREREREMERERQ